MEKIEPLAGGRMEMHVQRHDNHDKGHLTPEGRENARKVAEEKVRKYLDSNPETNFLVIASDQVFDEGEPGFGGLRAIETAQEIVRAIREELEKRGLPQDHLFGGEEGFPIAISPNLREAGIFSNKFMAYLREKYPDKKPPQQWSLYYEDVEAKTREGKKAESPLDLAKRMDYMFKEAETVGSSFYKTPGKEKQPLIVWIVGHGGGLDSFLHHYAGVPLEEVGFPVSEGFTMKYDPKKGVIAVVKGREYLIKQSDDMELPEHGTIKDDNLRVPKWTA